MSRVHCRCRKCEARKVFRRHPDFYDPQPVCWSCGTRSWRPDKWMNTRDTRKTGCTCAGYKWEYLSGAKHRMGSLFCWYRADGTARCPGDADFVDEYNLECE